MRRGTRGRCGAATAAVGIALAGVVTPVKAQTPPPLPTEVREWLARDQLQRWAQLLQEGDSLFHNGSCRRCHGQGGTEGRNAPDLTDAEWVQSDGSLEGIRETIFWGVRRRDMGGRPWRFEMNPGGGMDLEWDQYAALAAYVWSLTNGTHLPGR